MCVGSIPFLPKKELWNGDILCARENHCNAEALPLLGWNRPFVILRIVQRQGSGILGDLMCDCAKASTQILTSTQSLSNIIKVKTFQKTKVDSHALFQNLIKFRESIPIQQPGAGPIPMPRLTLERGQLFSPSYVKAGDAQHVYRIPWTYLWNFWFSKATSTTWGVRLSQSSYNYLMARFGIMPQHYEDTGILLNSMQWKMAKALLPGLDFTSPAILLSNSTHQEYHLQSSSGFNQQCGSLELESGRKDGSMPGDDNENNTENNASAFQKSVSIFWWV